MKQTWIVHHDWRGGWWAEVPGNGDLVAFSDTREGLDAAIDEVLAHKLEVKSVSKCIDSCKRPTPAQAHCTTCHRTFGGSWGFDRHRRDGVCLNPTTIGMMEMEAVWRTPMDQEKVTLFKDRVRGTRGRKTGVE